MGRFSKGAWKLGKEVGRQGRGLMFGFPKRKRRDRNSGWRNMEGQHRNNQNKASKAWFDLNKSIWD